MARLGRKARILKWTGLVLSLLIALAWVVSIPWSWDYVGPCTRSHVDPASGQPIVTNYTFILSLSWGCLFRFLDRRTDSYPETSIWRVRLDPAWPVWMPYGRGRSLVLPLWIPFLLVAFPTIHLWRADRPIPPGHCQKCGYNHTGNISGVCPECGEKMEKLRRS